MPGMFYCTLPSPAAMCQRRCESLTCRGGGGCFLFSGAPPRPDQFLSVNEEGQASVRGAIDPKVQYLSNDQVFEEIPMIHEELMVKGAHIALFKELLPSLAQKTPVHFSLN
ncbi:unnamed protein product [Coccothraustes coccothraustes]